MDGMDAHDYAAAFEQGAVARLAAVVAGEDDEVVAIAWRVVGDAAAAVDACDVACVGSASAAADVCDHCAHTLQVRKMFIHLNSTHGNAFARAFLQHKLVEAALDLLFNERRRGTVEVALWCISEVILCENASLQVYQLSLRPPQRLLPPPTLLLPLQLRQQGTVAALCKFLSNDTENMK